jgi:hypothetical protein
MRIILEHRPRHKSVYQQKQDVKMCTEISWLKTTRFCEQAGETAGSFS